MAKLTQEQKDANKLERQARNKRYAQRCRLHSAAKERLEAVKQALPEKTAALNADAATQMLIQERESSRSEILARMAALEAELAGVNETFAPRVEVARQARTTAYALLRAATTKLDDELNAQFPDMVGVYGPAQWREELIAESR